MIWFTADHHFGHENIIKFCNRPFQTIDEMDTVLFQRWNEKIKHDDTVYHLGDFTLQGMDKFRMYIGRLNGSINIVPGGHDFRWLDNARKETSGSHISILEPLVTLELPDYSPDGKHPLVIVLCHYAMRVWDRSHYGSLHLYGHSHGNLPGIENSMDVGVDTNNFYPYSVDDVLKKLGVSYYAN
jgi:calcineurin-like phosphoesterase family protein